MPLPLELDILFHTDETERLKEANLDYKLSDCDVKKITFYHINAIAPYQDDSLGELSSVFSNGGEFICILTYNELKTII